MLAPPSSSGLLASLDPKKLSKPRQFSRSTTEKVTDNSLWTETPAEKLKRLNEEQSGKRRRATQGVEETDEDRKRRKVDREIKRQIEEHNVRPHFCNFFLSLFSYSLQFSRNRLGVPPFSICTLQTYQPNLPVQNTILQRRMPSGTVIGIWAWAINFWTLVNGTNL